MHIVAVGTRLLVLVAAMLALPALAATPPSDRSGVAAKAAGVAPKAYNVGGALALGADSGYQFASVTGPIRLDIGTIVNESATTTSGSVRVSLFLTPEPAPTTVLYTVTEVDLNVTIAPGAALAPRSYTLAFLPPPDGVYYVHMGVLEFEPATCASATHYCLDDYLTFTNRVRVTNGEIFDAGPPPATEVVVIEYYHPALDHYFLTASAEEAAYVDSGGAGIGWVRTGHRFVTVSSAAEPGLRALCRFYGSVHPGPNSHFYTLDRGECDGLIAMQHRTPAHMPRWNYEGIAFAAAPAVGGTCSNPAYPVPVHRLYNQGFGHGRDSNHRYTSRNSVVADMVGRGWLHEGAVFCVMQEQYVPG